MRHQQETEEHDCRNCGSTFNLAAQMYYSNICPECKHEQQMEASMDEQMEYGL
jgi:predicted Zn-ribbon and HTH transcriptional regulator